VPAGTVTPWRPTVRRGLDLIIASKLLQHWTSVYRCWTPGIHMPPYVSMPFSKRQTGRGVSADSNPTNLGSIVYIRIHTSDSGTHVVMCLTLPKLGCLNLQSWGASTPKLGWFTYVVMHLITVFWEGWFSCCFKFGWIVGIRQWSWEYSWSSPGLAS
jgi:hypothetical protein